MIGTLVPEVSLESFVRERESKPQSGDNESQSLCKAPSRSLLLHDLLLSPLHDSLSLSQRKISRKTSGTRVDDWML